MIWTLQTLRAVIGPVVALTICLVSSPGWAQIEGSAQVDQETSAATLAERQSAPQAALLAQNQTAPRSNTSSSDQSPVPNADKPNQTSDSLTEIIVTAQKRSEKLVDVPISITAIGGPRLETLQVTQLSDLQGYVPGLSVVNGGAPGINTISIRGLSSGYQSDFAGPLVATYIDDLPVGSSTKNGRGGLLGLDLNPYDIARVEILKGPQGTLYGANTMGGLVKYALVKPNLDEFEGQAGASLEHVDDSGGANYSVRGAVNMPIVRDQLALRVSGFEKHDAGYINNIGTGIEDANHSTESGARAVLLWQPMDFLTVQATALAQDSKIADATNVAMNDPPNIRPDGSATLHPLFGPQITTSNFPEPIKQMTRYYALDVFWDLGFATLTSATGFSELSTDVSDDLSSYTAFFPSVFPPGSLALYSINDHIHKFVQEARLANSDKDRLQWMIGGYYTRETGGEIDSLPTFTSQHVPFPPAFNLFTANQTGVYQEAAGFANVTFKVTDSFDLGAGDRYSSYKSSNCPGTQTGPFGAGGPCTSLPSTGVDLWMGNARYHIDQDTMVYVRAAKGYRPGSGCPSCGNAAQGIPAIVEPDSMTNYEAGFKAGSLLDHRLQLELAVFHIDWRNIQLEQISPEGFGYVGNGGTAVSNGAEFTAAYRIVDDLQLGATLDYTDAHLTQNVPGTAHGADGNQLPDSARWSGSFTADYRRPLAGDMSFILGGGYRYRDREVNQFVGSSLVGLGDPAPMPSQNIVDLYTGFVLKSVSARLYGKNIFNDRSYVGAQAILVPAVPRYVPIQPATIGLSVDYRF
jgi:iron complex outermembrane recepter protein